MNKKFLIIGLIAAVIIITISLEIDFEKLLLPEEVNDIAPVKVTKQITLEDVEILVYSTHSFHKDLSGQYEIWCEENNGRWNGYDTDCDFETRVDSMKAKADLDLRQNAKVELRYAKAIFDIMELPIPDEPQIKGTFDMNLARTYVTLYKYDTQYSFYYDVFDPDRLAFRICEKSDIRNYEDDCQWQKEYIP